MESKNFYWECLSLKMQALQSFETVQNTEAVIQHHIPKYLNPQPLTALLTETK